MEKVINHEFCNWLSKRHKYVRNIYLYDSTILKFEIEKCYSLWRDKSELNKKFYIWILTEWHLRGRKTIWKKVNRKKTMVI